MAKTVVVGLDGGNWPLIESWIDDGSLPNLARLREEGAWGVSKSYLPPVTCPNWKCYASGKNPGKLGIFWWERINTEERSMYLPDATDFTSPEIWDYVNDAGDRAGIMNLPMTYPPRNVEGFMVAGGPRSRESNYSIPEELQSELEERFNYRVHPENVLTSNKNSEKEVEMIHKLLRIRLRAAKAMVDEQELSFFHVTLFHLNVLQHYFWDGKPTKRAWEIIDEELKPFVEGDYNLILMSDHGCTEIDTVFYINQWLEENGYLKTKKSLSSRLHNVGITQERVASIVRSLGLEKRIRPLIPRAIIERFPTDEGVVREEKLSMVDWENTKAIGSGQGLVYVVAESEQEREQILTKLENDLSEVISLNGQLIARTVKRREDVYNGEYVDQAPDLIFDQRPGVHTSEAMGSGKVMSEPTNWRGENVLAGMVLFHGDDIKSQNIDDIRISDIAPTILHWMGLAVPTDMDGSPVIEVFNKDSECEIPANTSDGSTIVDKRNPGQREIETRAPLTQDKRDRELDESVQNRLEEIGYLE